MAVMPCARAVRGFIRVAERPATVSVPWSIDSAPVTILISVDFPAPFSPTSAWTSPARRSNDTPRSACTPANDLAIDSARSRTLSNGAPVTRGVVSHHRSPGACPSNFPPPHGTTFNAETAELAEQSRSRLPAHLRRGLYDIIVIQSD